MTDKKKCEFCDKRGLPLLLVRDAVAIGGAGAPKAPALPIALGDKAAHYTKRLLRSGYVYLYDEARRRFEAYFVTPQGFYFKLLRTAGVASVVPAKPFNCPDEGDRAVASCITISDPKNAKTVRIGFSDVLWTKAMLAKHEDADWRARHMRVLDVQAALHGRKVAHAEPIANVDALVAEYAMEPTQGQKAFAWSPFGFDARQDRSKRLKQECERLRPGKGLILTLDDPAGVAEELALLMTRNTQLYLDNPKFKRPLAVSSVIVQLEEAIKSQAEIAEIDAAEQLANQQVGNNPLGHALFQSTRDQTEQIRAVTPAESDRAAAQAWKAYTAKYSEPKRKAWQDAFDAGFKTFDADFIAPLATAHAAWMKSEPMGQMVEGNFDPDDIQSGIALTALVSHMIAGARGCLLSTCSTQLATAMLPLLEKFLDLPRDLRLGTTWLVFATFVVGADAYAIMRFDLSLLSVLAQVDTLSANPPSLSTLLTEGFYALTTVVLAWFYVMPTFAFLWRHLLIVFSTYLPEWLKAEGPYPRSSAGWELIFSARIRAIKENNAILLNACEHRAAEGRARDLVLRCVLAIMVLSLLALFQSTPATGPSLVLALYVWMDALPRGYQLLLFALSPPAFAFGWAVLADHGAEFDKHIRLSAQVADRRAG